MEGLNQLKDYSDWMESDPEIDERKILVFLTIHGERATSIQKGYLPISYLAEIKCWLSECLPLIRAPRVAEAVSQYLESIHELRSLREAPIDGKF